MSKSRLGKGLDDLLPQSDERKEGELHDLPVDDIVPNPRQPRDRFDPDRLEELTQSIQKQGVVEPIVVRPHQEEDARFMIVAGERRWRAAQQAQLERIPGIVRDVEPEKAYLLSLVENLQRENLSPLEEARAYRRLLDEEGLSQQQAARALGKSRSAVANRVRLLNLPDRVLEALEEGSISAGHARALLGAPEGERTRLLEVVLREELSVRQTESRIAEAASRPDDDPEPADADEATTAPDPTPGFRELEGELESSIGAPVRIESEDRKKGRIIIEFSSPDEFDRLRDRFRAGSDPDEE